MNVHVPGQDSDVSVRRATSFGRCSLIVNNHMRACPPCCPGGLCVVLFHCRWASCVCAHRRVHDVSLHGSTVRRGEQARGNTRRSVVGRRSVALGLVRGNLLGISFFHLFFLWHSFPLPFYSNVDRPLVSFIFSPILPASSCDPPCLQLFFCSLPFFFTAFHCITQHFLDQRKWKEKKKKDIQLVDTL